MLIYWFYGRTHSPLADPREAAARTAGESFGNTLKIAGYLLLFNGAAITLLALLTEWNVTNETLARLERAGRVDQPCRDSVTPEIADRFGLSIVGFGSGRGRGVRDRAHRQRRRRVVHYRVGATRHSPSASGPAANGPARQTKTGSPSSTIRKPGHVVAGRYTSSTSRIVAAPTM